MAEQASSTTAPSRRSLLAVATAATLLPGAAMASPSCNAARLLQLELEWLASLARLDAGGMTEEQIDLEAGLCAKCEIEIAAAPCDSRDAMLVKLRTVVRNGLVIGQIEEVDDEALIDGIIAYAERRH